MNAPLAMPLPAANDDAEAPDGLCFHCGAGLPAGASWTVRIAQRVRPMCCPGCAAVAQAIVAQGLEDFYRTRTGYTTEPGADGAAPLPQQLQLYDSPESLQRYTEAGAGDSRSASFSVEGLRCAACVWLIERRLARLPGLQAAELNVASATLEARWSDAACRPSDILQALRGIGYTAYPFDPARQAEGLRRAARALGRKLFVAALCMMQVMMYAYPSYFGTDLEPDEASLLRWASLLLTLPAISYSALPFFQGAWQALKQRAPAMDLPVALGMAAAFLGSAWATWQGRGEVYFDSLTMFIFLLLAGRRLELAARCKAAAALERMQLALPAAATRLAAYPSSRASETVAASELRPGDVILVRPGEAVAADGVVLEGESALDVSLLSGESRPQAVAAGAAVAGGALNAGQPLLLRVSRAAQDSTLAALMRLARRAGQARPKLAQWADRVAGCFVAGLLLLALAAFAFWQWQDPARAWPVAIAVLVVSCPCALSLATPSALAAAGDSLLRMGVLAVQPHVLQTLERVSHVVFDKTGTLTMGRPELRDIQAYGAAAPLWCLGAAAALEEGSAHPLAAALRAAAQRAGVARGLDAGTLRHRPGLGVEGEIEGLPYRLGSAAFVQELTGLPCPAEAAHGLGAVWLGNGGGWLARFALEDALRADAGAVVRRLQEAGKQVLLLSGDCEPAVQRVAHQLGIDAAYGACLPQQKLEWVRALQGQGAVVAMVGDGINDAAVLRAADVSFAMGSGAALAQSQADAVLLSPRLDAFWQALALSRRAMAVVRQNLAWAVLYNALAIPAAALGWLSPWLSGVGMAASSALVVANALRLRRLPPRLEQGEG